MRRLSSIFTATSLLCLSLFAAPRLWAETTTPSTTAERVSYVVTVADPVHHRFRVTAAAENVTAGTVTFAIPAWSPGWYVLTHAYRNIDSVSATDETGHSLTVTHPDDLTWRVQRDTPNGVAHTITLAYDLAGLDQDPDALDIRQPDDRSYGFFAPYLDSNNGFVPGPAALMYVDGAKTVPCRVTYRTPPGWSIASANDPVPGDPTTFTAPDYDTLADQPADLGRFRRQDRTIEGVPVSVVVVGGEGISATAWDEDAFRIAAAGIRFMGKAPFPRYIFHCRFPAGIDGGGGLEHKNGTVLTLPPSSLRRPEEGDLELVAHEFFHAWNVKRLRPAELGPFDYAHAVRTPDLWWLEGVTDYIAPLIAVRAGVVPTTYWRIFMGSAIGELQNNSARRFVSLETASLKAWEGKSEGFGGLTYYNKGAVVGLLLDIEMRRRTGNRVGLSDLLKALYSETETSGRGYPGGEIERLASKLTGSNLKPFFDRAIRSTDELPYDDILGAAGLILVDASDSTPDTGLHFGSGPGGSGVQITEVEAGSLSADAGLQVGDQVIAIDGRPVSDANNATTALAHRRDASVSITVRRNKRLRILTIHAPVANATSSSTHDYYLSDVPNPTPQQAAILTSISGAGTPSSPVPQAQVRRTVH